MNSHKPIPCPVCGGSAETKHVDDPGILELQATCKSAGHSQQALRSGMLHQLPVDAVEHGDPPCHDRRPPLVRPEEEMRPEMHVTGIGEVWL